MSDYGSANARAGQLYGRPAAVADETLTRVGPGTPMGELLRRYWHPIARGPDASARPRKVRFLGEDLILFRDGKGRPGLIYPRCMHRGTSLFYGKVGDEGIRCCYHGWLFDVEGRCLNQPCEPGGGAHRDRVRQPWYPVEERYGMIWAYFGPPEKKPILPRYDILENLGEDECVAIGFGGPGATQDDTFASFPHVPYNWLQMVDNIVDPMHVQVLHSTFSIVQFVPEFAAMPKVDYYPIDNGVGYAAVRDLDDGKVYNRKSAWLIPNIQCTPGISIELGQGRMVGFVVPVDDTHFLQVFLRRAKDPNHYRDVKVNGKYWKEFTEEEHQDVPHDFESQMGQGFINKHSDEHLVQSDRGILLLRKTLKQQMKIVADGGDPAGVSFTEAGAMVHIPSGNYVIDAGEGPGD